MPTLAEILPTMPDEFPDDSTEMSQDLRVERFRPVANRLLKATAVVNEFRGSDEWTDLDQYQMPLDGFRNSMLANLSERVLLATTVVTYGHRDPHYVVTAGFHTFGGDSELRIVDHHGLEEVENVDEKGQTSSFHIRGVFGYQGNPDFGRDGNDCEPEMQTLHLRTQNYSGGEFTVAYDAGRKFEFPVPHDAYFARASKSPTGDEVIVDLAEQVAEYLESIPVVSEPATT